MQVSNSTLQQAVELLRTADGEDIQTLLHYLMMEEQLTRQLIMTQPWELLRDTVFERMQFQELFFVNEN